jgi:hypothetical protein
VLAIYALILNAIFAPAVSAAPYVRGNDSATVICRAELGHGDLGGDTGKQHDECGACQGLCAAHHGGVGIAPARLGMGWLAPRRSTLERALPASDLPMRRMEVGVARARAPPHLGSSFA